MSSFDSDEQSKQQESEDSLFQFIQKEKNQKELQNYLSFQLRGSKPNINTNGQFTNNRNNFPGFSTANNYFKPQSIKKTPYQLLHNKFEENQDAQSEHSTVTLTPKNIKTKDSKINKELQKPALKDLEDLGKQCGGCKSPGLSYKERNRRLIQQHEAKSQKIKKQQQRQLDDFQDEKKQIKQELPTQQNLELNFQEYKFDPNLESLANPERVIKNPIPSLIDPNNKFHHIIQKSKVQSQKKLKIQGHTVYFPYEPYEAQVKYMGQVLESLDKSKNAILQSPTGTGKTLCLLSATLSWVQEEFLKTYKEVSIIYLSRTHSQLAQVQKQLEKTCFRPTVAVFGSREILCIKDELKQLKGREKVEACSKGVKLYIKYGKDKAKRQLQFDKEQDDQQEQRNKSQKKLSNMNEQQRQKLQDAMCHYYSSQRSVLDLARSKFKNKIITTQKIKQLGKTYNFCPYYYPTFIKPICNLFFMPYNYLLDDSLNAKYKDIISQSILIFDEAHNVPESSCDGRSFSINRKTFEDAKKELQKLIKTDRMSQQLMNVKMDYDFKLPGLEQQVDRIFTRINNFITEIDFPSDEKVTEDQSAQKKIFWEHETQQKVYQLLYEKCYDHEKKIFQNLPKDEARRELITKMVNQIRPEIELISELCEQLQETPDGIFQNIEKVAGFVKRCIGLILQDPAKFNWMDRQVNHYRLMVKKVDKNWQIEMVCLVPFLTMKSIYDMKPKNIILTSGTLSPLETWQSELGIPFPIRFSNNHVINPNQLKLRVMIGQDKESFNFSYKYLQQNFKTIYKFTIKAIIQLAQKVPNGILVITPSYKVMNSLQNCLQYNPDLRKRLNQVKKCFTQTKDSFQDLIKKYRKAAMEPKGALLFCVCRGKISEGIDFPNQLCRAVIFVGIPFPNVRDIVINQKKNHYDRIAKNQPNCKFSGDKWYENLTFRSVNQAIGRVIRHIYDFGTIFLLDLRYNYPKYRAQLPKWSAASFQASDLTPDLIEQIQYFYNEMEEKFGNYEGKQNIIKDKSLSFEEESQQPKLNDFKQQNKFQMNKQTQHKVQNKKPFTLPSYKNAPYKEQNKKPPNAFAAIMGTNQNLKKKKSSNLYPPNTFQ